MKIFKKIIAVLLVFNLFFININSASANTYVDISQELFDILVSVSKDNALQQLNVQEDQDLSEDMIKNATSKVVGKISQFIAEKIIQDASETATKELVLKVEQAIIKRYQSGSLSKFSKFGKFASDLLISLVVDITAELVVEAMGGKASYAANYTGYAIEHVKVLWAAKKGIYFAVLEQTAITGGKVYEAVELHNEYKKVLADSNTQSQYSEANAKVLDIFLKYRALYKRAKETISYEHGSKLYYEQQIRKEAKIVIVEEIGYFWNSQKQFTVPDEFLDLQINNLRLADKKKYLVIENHFVNKIKTHDSYLAYADLAYKFLEDNFYNDGSDFSEYSLYKAKIDKALYYRENNTQPIDNIPPSLVIPSNKVITLDSKTPIVLTAKDIGQAVATDNIDGNLAVNWEANADMPLNPGSYMIVWSAIDSAGNGVTKTQNITINPPANAMVFIKETIDDNTQFNANTKFTKTWTLKNAGSNTWDSSYCLKHYDGDYLGDNATSVCVSGNVAPGGQYTFSVPMTSPNSLSNDETYTEYYRMTQNGKAFGGSIWAKIIVKGLASPQLTVGLQTENSIELSWNAVEGASLYKLYSVNGFSGTENTLIYSGQNLTHTHTNLTDDTNYYYKIQSCINETSCSDLSTVLRSFTTKQAGDKNLLVQNFNLSSTNVKQGESITLSAEVFNDGGIAYNDKFRFYFTLNDNAIYSSGSDDRFYLPENQTQKFSYQYDVLDTATTGNYKLSACVTYSPSINKHDYYCKDAQITISELPVVVPESANKLNISFYESTTNGDRLFISWSNTAEFYRLFRANSSNGTYSQIYAGINSGYNDKDITLDTKYFYKLKSCQTSSTSTCSDFSSVFSGVASNNYEADAEDDFYVTWAGFINNVASITQRYKGTREKLADSKVGIYLSNDTTCSIDDDFLGGTITDHNKNDTFDVIPPKNQTPQK